MNDETGANYLSPWMLGETIIGLCGMGVVEASNSSTLAVGDRVVGSMEWPWKRRFNIDADKKKHVYQKVHVQ